MKHIFPYLTLVFVLINASSFAQKKPDQVDLNNFMKDIMLSDQIHHDAQMAIWMPTIFWEVVSANNPQMTPESTKLIVDIIDRYVIVCVVQGDFDTKTRKFNAVQESTLRKKIRLNYEGKSYKSLYYNELTPEAQAIKEVMEPLFKNMLGQFGEGMTILYFEANDSEGNPIIDPYKKGELEIEFEDTDLLFELPLPSLLNDKECETDQKIFPGNYIYCPFHGVELIEKVSN